jgi:hypothetical protein
MGREEVGQAFPVVGQAFLPALGSPPGRQECLPHRPPLDSTGVP